MKNPSRIIPIVDLFAGPGGLGEGFSAYSHAGAFPFKIGLSVEKDRAAHSTLELRAFFRQFPRSDIPNQYYEFLRGHISREALFAAYPEQADSARKEARHGELGSDELPPGAVDEWVRMAIDPAPPWVLIGGPPCQAYSTVGRARNRGIKGYDAAEDPRHYLYREYLRIVARHWPSMFVMENVKGLLSARVNGQLILDRILADLSDPASATTEEISTQQYRYQIYSLVTPTLPGLDGVPQNPASDFLIECEQFGIPQMRHRVILLGIRDDMQGIPRTLTPLNRRITVRDVLDGLPRLRGGLSRDSGGNMSHSADTRGQWKEAVKRMLTPSLRQSIKDKAGEDVLRLMERTLKRLAAPVGGRGGEFVPYDAAVAFAPDWYLDPNLGGVCNSSTRSHLVEDLYRYFYASSFAAATCRSPRLRDFPEELLPKHRNVSRALRTENFADRFRVQLADQPSTTVMSHIAKDGHYYIHYDPAQLRSLTVREAARLQTFPDNYFFCGNRTEQYSQVGNAVPPLLAMQIADVVFDLLNKQEAGAHERRAIA